MDQILMSGELEFHLKGRLLPMGTPKKLDFYFKKSKDRFELWLKYPHELDFKHFEFNNIQSMKNYCLKHFSAEYYNEVLTVLGYIESEERYSE